MTKVIKTQMKAWLITWEGTSRKITDENRILAIISSKRRGPFIEDLVDIFYQMSSDTAYEMAYMANRKKERYRRNRVNIMGKICFGHDPFIYARVVRDLKIVRNENNLTETLVWHEPEETIRDPDYPYEFKIVEPEKIKQLTRSICNPLLNVIH